MTSPKDDKLNSNNDEHVVDNDSTKSKFPSKEKKSTRLLKLVAFLFSLITTLLCSTEIDSRISLLNFLEQKKLNILEQMSSNGETLFESPKSFGEELKLTELLINEVNLLISQGASTSINLRRKDIIKYYSINPKLAQARISNIKRDQTQEQRIQDELTSIGSEISELEIKLKRLQNTRENSRDPVALERISDVLNKFDNLNLTDVKYISTTIKDYYEDIFVENIAKREGDKYILEEEALRYVRKIKDYINSGLIESENEINYIKYELNNYKDSEILFNAELEKIQQDKDKDKPIMKEIEAMLDYLFSSLSYKKLSSDELLALLFISSGVLGSIILTIRNISYIFEARIIMVGASTGFIIFLSIKGGPNIFINNMESFNHEINVYSSSLFGIISGLFSEKIYSLLSKVVDKLDSDVRDKIDGG